VSDKKYKDVVHFDWKYVDQEKNFFSMLFYAQVDFEVWSSKILFKWIWN